MASIIKTSINLNDIPKDKIYVGKKGKYLPITITLNDEPDQFGNQGQLLLNRQKKSVMLRRRRHILAMLKLCGLTVQTLILHHVITNQLHQLRHL